VTVRRTFYLVALSTGLSADYYMARVYEKYPRNDMQQFIVDATPVSMPGAFIHARPKTSEQHMTLFYPRNGTVILARPVEGYPDWLEMINGQYVRRQTCGQEVVKQYTAASAVTPTTAASSPHAS
jgi:hypothetical protein